MTMTKGTLSDAINAVTTMDIVEHFGVPYRVRRGRTYLLCPGHDDNHYGSCYVDKNDNGYYCYVCGEHVRKWDMALRLSGNNSSATAELFFRLAGITPTNEFIEDPYKKAQKLIKKLEQYIKNDAVYNDTCVCDKIDSSYGRNINGEYLFSEKVVTNPMLEMYKKSKTLFQQTVMHMLDNESKKVARMMAKYNKDSSDGIFVASIGIVPADELVNACKVLEKEINDLMVEVQTL